MKLRKLPIKEKRVNKESLLEFLNNYLSIDIVDDYSYNGLQFDGNNQIENIGFAVDAGCEVFQRAIERNIDFLVVHHGLYWKKQDPRLIGVLKKRVDLLFKGNMSLYAAHLPLDMHEEVGNNSGIIKILGANEIGRFSPFSTFEIGAIGEFEQSISINSFEKILGEKFDTIPFTINGHSRGIKRFAVMSGACSRDDLYEASLIGADLLITGERSEFYHDCKDYGISVSFLGHHASERVGVSLLMEKVSTTFPTVKTHFIDCPTGL